MSVSNLQDSSRSEICIKGGRGKKLKYVSPIKMKIIEEREWQMLVGPNKEIANCHEELVA